MTREELIEQCTEMAVACWNYHTSKPLAIDERECVKQSLVSAMPNEVDTTVHTERCAAYRAYVKSEA